MATDTAATHDPWHGRNPWGCCQDRNTHGGPGCKWPGTETEPLTTPATAATVTVDRADLNAAWGVVVAYASRMRDDRQRATVDALADRLRVVLEAR